MKMIQLFMRLLLVGFVSLLASFTAQAKDESIGSLRGIHGLAELSEAPLLAKIILPDEGILPRDVPHQPPLIPHAVDRTRISLKSNQCLGCHGRLEFKDIGATEIGENHYINRAGEELGSISTRYYFCTQCHAPQVNLKPIIANDFKTMVSAKNQIKVKDSRKSLDKRMNRKATDK